MEEGVVNTSLTDTNIMAIGVKLDGSWKMLTTRLTTVDASWGEPLSPVLPIAGTLTHDSASVDVRARMLGVQTPLALLTTTI